MSVFEKQRKNRSYVYFQTYDGGKRKAIYLGARDEMVTWEKAERLFLEYLDKRLEGFYSQIPTELRDRIQPKDERRWLLEAVRSQTEKELLAPKALIEGSRAALTPKKKRQKKQ